VSFVLTLLVAAVIGSLGAAIAGRREQGCLVNILVGFAGALLGRWLSRTLDIDDPLSLTIGETTFPLVWSVVGAALFVAVIVFLTGGRVRKG
jgi:uncharacterized membrane protein YeaQ/YmgE (transglycosylase-associated protein family)